MRWLILLFLFTIFLAPALADDWKIDPIVTKARFWFSGNLGYIDVHIDTNLVRTGNWAGCDVLKCGLDCGGAKDDIVKAEREVRFGNTKIQPLECEQICLKDYDYASRVCSDRCSEARGEQDSFTIDLSFLDNWKEELKGKIRYLFAIYIDIDDCDNFPSKSAELKLNFKCIHWDDCPDRWERVGSDEYAYFDGDCKESFGGGTLNRECEYTRDKYDTRDYCEKAVQQINSAFNQSYEKCSYDTSKEVCKCFTQVVECKAGETKCEQGKFYVCEQGKWKKISAIGDTEKKAEFCKCLTGSEQNWNQDLGKCCGDESGEEKYSDCAHTFDWKECKCVAPVPCTQKHELSPKGGSYSQKELTVQFRDVSEGKCDTLTYYFCAIVGYEPAGCSASAELNGIRLVSGWYNVKIRQGDVKQIKLKCDCPGDGYCTFSFTIAKEREEVVCPSEGRVTYALQPAVKCRGEVKAEIPSRVTLGAEFDYRVYRMEGECGGKQVKLMYKRCDSDYWSDLPPGCKIACKPCECKGKLKAPSKPGCYHYYFGVDLNGNGIVAEDWEHEIKEIRVEECVPKCEQGKFYVCKDGQLQEVTSIGAVSADLRDEFCECVTGNKLNWNQDLGKCCGDESKEEKRADCKDQFNWEQCKCITPCPGCCKLEAGQCLPGDELCFMQGWKLEKVEKVQIGHAAYFTRYACKDCKCEYSAELTKQHCSDEKLKQLFGLELSICNYVDGKCACWIKALCSCGERVEKVVVKCFDVQAQELRVKELLKKEGKRVYHCKQASGDSEQAVLGYYYELDCKVKGLTIECDLVGVAEPIGRVCLELVGVRVCKELK